MAGLYSPRTATSSLNGRMGVREGPQSFIDNTAVNTNPWLSLRWSAIRFHRWTNIVKILLKDIFEDRMGVCEGPQSFTDNTPWYHDIMMLNKNEYTLLFHSRMTLKAKAGLFYKPIAMRFFKFTWLNISHVPTSLEANLCWDLWGSFQINQMHCSWLMLCDEKGGKYERMLCDYRGKHCVLLSSGFKM